MIKIIAYLFAVILMCISLFSASTHLRTIPTYLKLKLTSPHVLLGLSLSLLSILSVIVSVWTFIEPKLLWLFVALVFIFINIFSWVYMLQSVSKDLGQIYKEQKANE